MENEADEQRIVGDGAQNVGYGRGLRTSGLW